MAESVESWWKRRQWSKGTQTPYAVGQFRADWERYPVLIRQYHPDLNRGITLTQIPPAAEVLLVWVCDAGHYFVATPGEQRQRPGATRRRSSWCPDCATVAVRRTVAGPASAVRARSAKGTPAPVAVGADARGGVVAAAGAPGAVAAGVAPGAVAAAGAPGEAFDSPRAPKPASAAEARLRRLLGERLQVDLSRNSIRVAQPFFGRLEVWPDIPIPELRVAIEYDTTGRDGLEHVGRREKIDRRKDRLLRAVDWEVVRIRCGKLQPLGQWDLLAPGVSDQLIERLIDRLEEIRGSLIVRSYLR